MSEFYQIYNNRRYQADGVGLHKPGDDSLGNKGMQIEFTYIPTGKKTNFKAFIESFTESYKPAYSAEQVLGRMDPIYLFKETTRSISLSFKVPAATAGEAYENLGKVQNLIQFMYPVYKNAHEASSIVQAPLLRVKVMNMLRDVNNLSTAADQNSNTQTATNIYNSYDMEGKGILCTINNISFNYNLETEGVVEKYSQVTTSANAAEGEVPPSPTLDAILPKLIEVNMDIQPIHEHPLGWNRDDEFGKFRDENGSQFPYGAPLFIAPPNPWSQPETPSGGEEGAQSIEEEPTTGDAEEELPAAGPEDPPVVANEGHTADGDSGETARIDEQDGELESVEEDLDGTSGRCWFFCSRRGRGEDNRTEQEILAEEYSSDEFLGQYEGRTYGEGATPARGRSSWEDRPDDPGSMFTEEEIEIMQQDSYYDDRGMDYDYSGHDDMSEFEDWDFDAATGEVDWEARREEFRQRNNN